MAAKKEHEFSIAFNKNQSFLFFQMSNICLLEGMIESINREYKKKTYFFFHPQLNKCNRFHE